MKQHSKRGALQLKMLFAAVVLTLSISASTGTVYNRSCYNPLAYLGTANATYNSDTNTCNYWYAGFSGSGQVFENVNWGNVNASTFPSGDAVNKINSLKGSCCSDGKGIMWVDYSRSCYNPSTYNGTASYTNNGQTNTCDTWYGGLSQFENVTWSTVTASTFPSDGISTLNVLKGSCCSDGKGIMWVDTTTEAPTTTTTTESPTTTTAAASSGGSTTTTTTTVESMSSAAKHLPAILASGAGLVTAVFLF